MCLTLMAGVMAWTAIAPVVTVILILLAVVLALAMLVVMTVSPVLTTVDRVEMEVAILVMGLVAVMGLAALILADQVGRMGLAAMAATMVAALVVRVILGTTNR
jgi:hypothetical protein